MSSTIPYGRQDINQDDIQAVIDVLKSDYLTQGPEVKKFETNFAQYVGAKFAVAVSNGTTALHLAAKAVDIRPGQKIITTPITFVATSNCVLYCGGEVEFADIDPKTFCLDPNKVEDILKKDPSGYSGIIPVDFAGHPADIQSLRFLADKYKLWIIEDACHAPGSATFEKGFTPSLVGSCKYSDVSIFSFHPVKHIACGEGGMITTNNFEHYQKMIKLRTHGILREQELMSRYDGGWYYEMQELGYNYRIPDMLCALGNSQLKRADESLKRRRAIADKYFEALADLSLSLPFVSEKVSHAYHLFIIKTELRKELYDFLKTKDIYTQVHYIPVYQHPYYRKRYGDKSFAVADDFYSKCLSLPMYQSMTAGEQDRVIAAIKEFFNK